MGEPPGGRRNPAAFLRFWGAVARVCGWSGEQGDGESERGGRGESGVVPGGPRVILCSTRKNLD